VGQANSQTKETEAKDKHPKAKRKRSVPENTVR
jgi:hypothetical protein